MRAVHGAAIRGRGAAQIPRGQPAARGTTLARPAGRGGPSRGKPGSGRGNGAGQSQGTAMPAPLSTKILVSLERRTPETTAVAVAV